MILTIGFAFSLGVLFPVFMEEFDESRERTAWVSSITMAVFMFLGPVMGAFVNRFGMRVSIFLGCLSCAAGLALGSLAPNIYVLYFVFSVPFATGVSFIYLAAPVSVTQLFTKRRSFALGTVSAGQGLGTMILGPTLQALEDAFNWRNTYLIMAGVLAIVSFTGCFYGGRKQPLETKNSKRFSWNFSVWKNRKFRVLIAMGAFENFCRIIPYVHLMKFCRDDLGMAADKSSTLFLFLGFFAAAGRILAGILCDFRCVNSLFLLQGAVFMSAVSIMALVVAKTYPALASVVVLFSLADGLVVSSFTIELFNSVKESQRASSLGFCLMAGGVFMSCSPPLSGLMADKFGNYTATFLTAGAVGVLGSAVPFVLLCMRKETDKAQDDQVFLEEIMDKDQTVFIKKEDESDDMTNSTSLVNLDPGKPVTLRTSQVRTAHERPVSFLWAMESPFYHSPS